MCILECFAVGWIYELDDIVKEVGDKSAYFWTIGFWFSLLGSCYIGAFVVEGSQKYWVTVLLLLASMSIVGFLSF